MDVAVVILTVLLILLVVLLAYGPSVIAILKGHLVWGIVGILLFAPIGWVGALMTAKPDSWWAKNRYSDEKRAEATAKYGEPAADEPSAAPAAAALPGDGRDWECRICGEVSATRVAAESHVRGAHPQAPVESSIAGAGAQRPARGR